MTMMILMMTSSIIPVQQVQRSQTQRVLLQSTLPARNISPEHHHIAAQQT